MSNVSFHAMTNRFAPPQAEVKDQALSHPTSWPRTIGAVAIFSMIALALAWFVAPLLAAFLMQVSGHEGPSIPTGFLVLDLAFSTVVFFGGCYLAARRANRHAVIASVAVGVVGMVVYFLQTGGTQGLSSSEFPLWYTFFPTHVLPAVVVAAIAARRES
jgi:hypothetical protein